MKRKIVKQGGSALTITLPLSWAKKNSLHAGDEVEVEEKERSLVINSEKSVSMGNAVVSFPKGYPFVRRVIDTPYRLGYDEIRVQFEESSFFNKIESEATNLLGFAIVNQGKDFCVIKNVAAGLDTEFDTMLNRLMMLTKNMLTELYVALEKNSLDSLENIAHMESITNRLCHFCKRMLNTKGYKDDRKTRSVFRIACLYEEIADEAKDICVFQQDAKIKISKAVLEIFKKILMHLDLVYSLFHKFDGMKVFDLATNEKKYLKECKELFLGTEGGEVIIIHHLMNILNMVKHMSEELS